MKNTTSVYILGIVALGTGSVMKVVGIPFGNGILLIGIVGVVLYQLWHISVLEKKIKDMENHTSEP